MCAKLRLLTVSINNNWAEQQRDWSKGERKRWLDVHPISEDERAAAAAAAAKDLQVHSCSSPCKQASDCARPFLSVCFGGTKQGQRDPYRGSGETFWVATGWVGTRPVAGSFVRRIFHTDWSLSERASWNENRLSRLAFYFVWGTHTHTHTHTHTYREVFRSEI